MPPPDTLPTVSAAEYQGASANIALAEKTLNDQGLKFASAGGKVDWDRDAMLAVLAQHPECGMEDSLPALTAFQKTMGDFVAKYGRGFFLDDGTGKKWMKADEDPLRSDRGKLDIVTRTIDTVKKESLRGECPHDSTNSNPGAPGTTDRAAPPQPPTDGHTPPPPGH